MKVNCSFGVLPLVYPINVEFAYISWFCLQKGNYIIHWDKMGLVLRVYWNQPESFWNTYTTIFTCCLLSWNELCSAGEAQCCWLNTSIKKEAKQICFQGFPHPVLSIYLEMTLDQVQEWYKWSSHLYYVVSISKTASAFNSSYLRGCAVGIIIPILQISVYLIFIHVCPCGISLFSSEDYRHWCTVTVFFKWALLFLRKSSGMALRLSLPVTPIPSLLGCGQCYTSSQFFFTWKLLGFNVLLILGRVQSQRSSQDQDYIFIYSSIVHYPSTESKIILRLVARRETRVTMRGHQEL